MTIDTNTWHYKVYRWWYMHKYGDDPKKANLCPYVRAVFLWSWLGWLFKRGKVWKIPVPAVTWGFTVVRLPFWAGVIDFKLKTLIFAVYVIAAGVACFVGVIVGIVKLIERYATGWSIRRSAPARAIREGAELLFDYAEAVHSRICPMIRFGNEAEHD